MTSRIFCLHFRSAPTVVHRKQWAAVTACWVLQQLRENGEHRGLFQVSKRQEMESKTCCDCKPRRPRV